MIGLDEERLFRGGRMLKIGVAFGFIFFFLLISFVIFALMLVTTIPGGYAEMAKYDDTIAMFGIATVIFSIPMLFLYRYYRHLYYNAVFEESSAGYYQKATPSKCSICGRHPVSKKYHLRSIHGIKEGDTGEYFENCGCKYCVKPIHITGV